MRFPAAASICALMAAASPAAGEEPQRQAGAARGERTEEILVTGRDDRLATGATKSTGKLVDEPQAITFIDSRVMSGQFALTQDQVLLNVPAVTRSQNQGNVGGSQNTSIRGFNTRTIYKDGARFTTIGEVYLNNIASVEVLKGPAGMLFGSTPPGGVIVYSRKKPQPEWAGSVGAAYGSDDFINPTVDVTGPLTEDGALSFRLIGSYVNGGQFIDLNDAESAFITPSLRYQKGDVTLDLVYEYGWREETFIFGLPFDLMEPAQTLPRDRFLGHPDNFKRTKDEAVSVQLAWDVADETTLRVLLNETRFTHTSKALRPFGTPLVGRTYVANGSLRPPTPTRDRSAEVYLTTSFDVAGWRNTTMAGGDYRKSRNDAPFCNGNKSNLFTASVDAPDYVSVNPLSFTCDTPGFVFFDAATTFNEEVGAFIQNDLWISQSLKLLAGLRYGEIRYDNRNLVTSARARQKNDATTARLGVVWKPMDTMSVYASFAESFQQLIGTSATNQPFLPTRGTQYEAGAKLELFGGRASVSAAVYEITQSNLTVPDPLNPGFSVQEGKVRSKGGELELSGQFGRRLTLVGGIGYTDNEVIGGANDGRRLPNVYKTKASLYAAYTLLETDAVAWAIGGGIFHHGNSFLNAANNRAIPQATLVDLMTSVTLPTSAGQWSAQLNVKNVFNTLDYTGGFGNASGTVVFPEPGRQIYLTVGYAF